MLKEIYKELKELFEPKKEEYLTYETKSTISHLMPYGKIGIGITTHNRIEVLEQTLRNINEYAPFGAKIVIVDDASTEPVEGATFRFETNVGIAKAKNKCFELLDDCDHIFLFDDDTYPIHPNWHIPYCESKEPHLMYIFEDFSTETKLNDTCVLYQDDQIKAFSHARGCMLYYKHICLEMAGGMDPVFGKWGWEHPQHSDRIFNLGLTTFRYMDVHNSNKLFYSADEHQEVVSTVGGQQRMRQISLNRPIYEARRNDVSFIPYRGENNIVITTYFTKHVDPQRGTKLEKSTDLIKPLINSMNGQKIVVLNDCKWSKFNGIYSKNVEFVEVETSQNPYFERWIQIYRYLIQNKVDKVFCVDATDVEMINNPFKSLDISKLYLGDEPTTVDCPWMINNHPAGFIQNFMRGNKGVLMNAGVIGGHSGMVKAFLNRFLSFYMDNKRDVFFAKDQFVGHTDMGLFNYIAYNFFSGSVIHGRLVTTVFKANERNTASWFKHK